jgi:hypothetical protein
MFMCLKIITNCETRGASILDLACESAAVTSQIKDWVGPNFFYTLVAVHRGEMKIPSPEGYD